MQAGVVVAETNGFHRVRRLVALLALVSGVLLLACRQQPTAVSLPTSTATLLPGAPTAQAAVPATPLPTTTAVPQPTPTPTAVFPPPYYFVYVTQISQDEAGQTAVHGIVNNGSALKLATLPVPGSGRIFNGDYAVATNQILYTDSARAAGPGNLAAGPLHSRSMSSGQTDTLIDDGVVGFAWAPDGKAFAYILAAADTYELRWHSAAGEDMLLAVDVPRAFAIAPSGGSVAFTRESNYAVGGEPGLYVLDVASRQEQQITAVDRAGLGGSGAAWQPVWSPDESSLLLPVAAEEGLQFVWASRDGRTAFTFSSSLMNEAINTAWQEANPDNAALMCADTTAVLLNGRSLVTGVSLCPEPMSSAMPGSHLAVLALDPDAQTVTVETLLPIPDSPARLVNWKTPGESAWVAGDNTVASVSLPVRVTLPELTDVPPTLTREMSPGDQWQVVYGLSEPVEDGDGGQVYRAYMAVQQANGGLEWVAVNEWRPYGLGLDYPAPLQWASDPESGDTRYLYFTNRPIVDGCGLFTNGSDLWRLDLTDGTYVQLVSYVGTSLALSPDGQTLAYASVGPGGPTQVILRNVANGAERHIDLDYDLPAVGGNLVWSPDGTQLLATVAYNPCLPPDWTHSIFLVDVAAETAVSLITHDERRLTTVEWTETAVARLIATDGTAWLLDLTSGDLTPAGE